MEVRRARPGDLEAVGEVTVAAYAGFLLGPDDPYVARLRDAARRHREAELWVAVEAGTVLGSVTVCPDGSPWREIARPGEGEFRMLAVSPTAHGRGVGELLARHAVERFEPRPVALSSLPMMHVAHRLYGRLGFTRAPERDWTPTPGVSLVAYLRPAADAPRLA